MSSDELGNGTKRRGESESMKNARMEVAAMKRGDFGRQETEDQPTYQTTFSGGIFPSHERVGSAEYDRETERLMEVCRMRDTPVIVFINKILHKTVITKCIPFD